ncbi:hypothetical protein [Curtobacterium herbarum]|uniref:Uncharacterized protein n=1 Tax=Curtobacterium herbarum TaxID=150122 RepID=A0ABP4K6P4_9MICO|nr:hypothetical protein [Curtobacterium herbarum]MBM7474911.1 hypothetical protein [Curtobacterium herbarum]MCS6545557.1 hypothetical protein [Curtobacterium herbarum]
MTDSPIFNPMLDEDDDEQVVAGPRVVLPRSDANRPTPVHREPRFGEKGFGKGKPHPHRGTPRARVTENDAPLLAYLNEVQVATTVAASTVLRARESRVSTGGRMLTPDGMHDKLKRLEKLGMVQATYSRDDRVSLLWGVTEAGIAAAQRFGYLLEDSQPNQYVLKDMKRRTQNHYRAIAQVGANFIGGVYSKKLGIGPVTVDQLISEPRMRREQRPIQKMLEARDKDNPGFGTWRERTLNQAATEIGEGKLAVGDLLLKYPELRTIGRPNADPTSPRFKDAHWPDLVIDLDKNRSSLRGKSLLIEVELSNKSWRELEMILATMAKEVARPVVYERVVYFTAQESIAKRILQADKNAGLNLVESGKLLILPIEDRFGTPFKILDTIAD